MKGVDRPVAATTTMTFILGFAMTALAAWIGSTEAGQGSGEVTTIIDLEERLARAWVKRDQAFIDAGGSSSCPRGPWLCPDVRVELRGCGVAKDTVVSARKSFVSFEPS